MPGGCDGGYTARSIPISPIDAENRRITIVLLADKSALPAYSSFHQLKREEARRRC
jgi:hypothetical protein